MPRAAQTRQSRGATRPLPLTFSRGGARLPREVIFGFAARQFFSRYPVLKIHHTATMQRPRNASVMPTLKATLTSEIS